MSALDTLTLIFCGAWLAALLLTIGMAFRDFCRALGRTRK